MLATLLLFCIFRAAWAKSMAKAVLSFTDFPWGFGPRRCEGRAKSLPTIVLRGKCSGLNAPGQHQRSKRNWKQQRSERGAKSVAGVLHPRTLLLLRRSISCPLLSLPVKEAQERYCKPRPGLLRLAGVFRENTVTGAEY
ncbi:hypothetical protein KCP70_24320 [Salmonella enterica subsp. enterica]|nr:hypothetical protein KCP70_24320 [Salmonella enterica subsp. enterica]